METGDTDPGRGWFVESLLDLGQAFALTALDRAKPLDKLALGFLQAAMVPQQQRSFVGR